MQPVTRGLNTIGVVIRNEGAYVSWMHNNQRYEYHTAPLINGFRIFLPLIIQQARRL